MNLASARDIDLRLAFLRMGAGPLIDPQMSGDFGGAEVRAWTFACALAQRPDMQVRFVYERPRDVTFSGEPRYSHRVQLHPVPARRRRREQRTLADWCRLPGDVASRWGRSLQQRLSKHVPVDARLADLSADMVAVFGLHDPTAAAIRTVQLRGAAAVTFLTSDADTEFALTNAESPSRTHKRHRDAILSANLVVAQTLRQKQLVEDAGQHAVLIRNPIDTRVDHQTWKPLERRSHVLWVGRADTDCKRADLLIELARQCPQVQFCAVMNPTRPEVTKTLCEAMPENVRRIERVTWEESDSLYADAMALVNTSDSEGFPNAFLQAGKWGVPILSLRVDPDQIVARHSVGFVADGQMSGLIKLVRHVGDQPQWFEHVSRAARRYVEQHHELQDRADDLAQALWELRNRRLNRTRNAA